MDRLVTTLHELGRGFAFLGRQVHFDVDGDDFYVDLLLFHTIQLRHVLVELKIGKFTPQHAGQLGFYVATVDRMRQPQHQPTVGLLLCTDRDETVVRYALGATTSPVAVSTYTYDTLPPAERAALPSEADVVRVVASVTGIFNVSITAEGFVTRGEPPDEKK